MRFAILGAGAIGAYVGASLARGGADVVLIAQGPHLSAMQRDGVRVRSPRGDFHAHPPATGDLGAIGDADVVFLGVKAYSLPELAPRIGEALRPDAVIVAAQNGIPWWYFQAYPGPGGIRSLQSVDPDALTARSIDLERVIGCVVYCSTFVEEPGVIRHVEGSRFAIGAAAGTSADRCAEIAAAFIAGGLKCPVERDLRSQIWLKLIGNAAFNPVTALTGATLGELGTLPEMVDLLRRSLEECTRVALALGVELPVSIERRLEAGIAVGEHKTSMQIDFESGRPLETGCIIGAVVELAKMLDIPVPHLETTYACLELADGVRHRAL